MGAETLRGNKAFGDVCMPKSDKEPFHYEGFVSPNTTPVPDDQEQPQIEIAPESLAGPWSDLLPLPLPGSPPEDPETRPLPSPITEPEPAPEPVPAARIRSPITPEQQATRQAAMRIATALDEKEPGPRAQVGRVVRVLGIERAQALYEQTLEVEAAGGMMLPDESRRRTPGGVFFKLVRDAASKEERWKIFSMRPQGNRSKSQSQPTQPASAAAPAPAVVSVITDIPNASGEARTVKITLVGRPGRIVAQNGYIITGMTARTVPALPKGMPTPPAKPTVYTVYISQKQWAKVAQALGNPDDILIAEGTPVYDPQLEGIAVYVTNTTTKLLQQAQRTAQVEG